MCKCAKELIILQVGCQVPDKCIKVNFCLRPEDNFIKITTCTFALQIQYLLKSFLLPYDHV